MRKEKTLIGLLRGLVNLLAEESSHNKEFALKLETLLGELPEKKSKPKKVASKPPIDHVPDIHAEWKIRAETDFRLWLRDQPIPVLREIIRSEDFDATRRTVKWKEAEKLAEFIADRLRDRQSRGSAFIGRAEPLPKNYSQDGVITMPKQSIILKRDEGLEGFLSDPKNIETDALKAMNSIPGVKDPEIVSVSKSRDRIELMYFWVGVDTFWQTNDYLRKFGLTRADAK